RLPLTPLPSTRLFRSNTFRVSFDKELRGGEARLSGEGKFVTGGSSDDKRDGTDFTGKLALTYPVFEGADFKLSGVYVNAKDDTKDRKSTRLNSSHVKI